MNDLEPCYRAIGMNIRRLRKARGWTQTELASIMDLTRTSVTNIEQGRQRILAHTLIEFAVVLESSPTKLAAPKS